MKRGLSRQDISALATRLASVGLLQVVLEVGRLVASARDEIDSGSILGLGRSPGGGHGNPLQYSCLENPMDRGAWRAKSIGSQRAASH